VTTRRWLIGLLVPAVAIAAWQAVASAELVSPHALPSPLEVVVRWWGYLVPAEPFDPAQGGRIAWVLSSELIDDALASLYRVALGFALGAGMALPLGLVMGASTRVHELMNPLIQFLRPIPPSAYIPLAMLWFGLGNPPAVFLIVIGAFFPILINTIAGVRNLDAVYLRAARNLGAGPITIFVRVMLPGATPYILAGARIGIGTAFILVIVSEMIAVNSGLGFRILEAREYFWTDKVIAGMFTVGLIGLAIDALISRISRHLLRWHAGLAR
jgi:NitT/TauT family transport system permease protein